MAKLLTQAKLRTLRRRVDALRREMQEDTYLPGETHGHDVARKGLKLVGQALAADLLTIDLCASLLNDVPLTSDEEVVAERMGIPLAVRRMYDSEKAKLLGYANETRKPTAEQLADLRFYTDNDAVRIAAHESGALNGQH